MKIPLTIYWKCQLIGWGVFTIVTYLALIIGYPEGNGFFARAIITCGFGLSFTHFIRWVIKRFKVFNKKFSSQIIYLLLITLIITFIANLGYVLLLYHTGTLDKNQIQKVTGASLTRTFFYLYYQELMVAFGWVSIYFLIHYIKGIRIVEKERANMQIKLIESEAQTLRAQMNPHFIFNSMNSIKSLINKNEIEKAANYLTTFSKLIRKLFNNSDKREVSLYDELETCKLYAQLEKMRFGNKIDFVFDIDERVDLKDIKVPTLILQPLIENAIWHGLMPKESGGKVVISVKENNGTVQCSIDDDGIGREMSKKYKSNYETTHQSKGMGLTRSRLELDKLLNKREEDIFILDKEDEVGKSEGTNVIIKFKENRN